MKKYPVCFILFFFVSANVAFAKPVTLGNAKQAAFTWMSQLKGERLNAGDISGALTENSGDDPAYFIFNFHPEGWVIISSDDIAHPVIGYSETGHYSPENSPPAFKGWMRGVSREIRNATKKGIKSSAKNRDAWERLEEPGNLITRRAQGSRSAGPLLQTAWDQNQYYNEQCPADPNAPWYAGGHAFAGCVATAMAQVMKYHNYPAQGFGSHSYSHSAYGTLSADFGNTYYDWAAMPNSISSSNYEIAKLIYHCGVSVNMDFGTDGSSGSSSVAANSLKKYFKYDDSVFYAQKSDYTAADWINMLKSNLDAGQPVIYGGEGATGGHAFVCDGYQNTDYFHFNMGWSNAGDGYFYLGSITPQTGSGTYNFTSGQDAVFNIRPSVKPNLSFPYYQGFETGAVPAEWSTSGNRVSISSAQVYNGSYSLLMGTTNGVGYNINSATLKINVPENGHLAFRVKRGYSPYSSPYNYQKAVIKSEFGDSVFYTFFDENDGDNNDIQWQEFSLDLSSWKNEVVKLYFEQFNSDTYNSQWMYIDGVEITGTSAQIPQVSWNVAASSQSVSENAGTATYTARLNTASNENIIIPFTVGGTAIGGGTDHSLVNGSITIYANSVSASKTFSIINDTSKESDKTVILTMIKPNNATLGTPSNLTITIEDDDDDSPDPDIYESNNTEAAAFNMPLSFSANAATVTPVKTTIHSTSDIDFFTISLPSGYDYTLSSRVHDSNSSGDGKTYTCNVKYSYKTGVWSSAYDTQSPDITVNDGGRVFFKVEPYSSGSMGTYALEISISRTEHPDPAVLSVTPSYRNISANSGRTSFSVSNTGDGSMSWSANTSEDWLFFEYEASILYVNFLANSGSERTGYITITAPGAENSPQTVQIIQAAGVSYSPDTYEANNTESDAAHLSPDFTDSSAYVKTAGANIHNSEDKDYYIISFEAGYDYTVSARVQDADSSNDGQIYSCDVKFSYKQGTDWFGDYDISASGEMSVSGGSVLIFKVIPGMAGQMGTYADDLTVTRTATVPAVLSLTPSSQNVSAFSGFAQFAVTNSGQGAMTWTAYTYDNWLFVSYDENYIYAYCLDNYSSERTGYITVNSPEAGSSQVTVIQAAGSALTADSYESNDSKDSAASLSANFADNSATVKTVGANLHNGTDADYYRLDLDSGYNYTIYARGHDSYSSSDGEEYGCDIRILYDTGAGSAYYYDTELPTIEILGGGTVWFHTEAFYTGETGTYALEIHIARVPSDNILPFLYINPPLEKRFVSYTPKWLNYFIINLGSGTLNCSAESSQDWLYTYVDGNVLFVHRTYNFGAERTAVITVRDENALHSPRTIEIVQEAGVAVSADAYENNDSELQAYPLAAVFSDDRANIKTENAGIHSFSDTDYYKLTLDAGYDYTVSARLHDRYDRADEKDYTCDSKFYYTAGDGVTHGEYDTQAEVFQVQNGGTVYFRTEPWTYGEAGTYALEITVSRTRIITKGDIDSRDGVTLSDAVIALQTVAGIHPGVTLNPDSDVNGDLKIGMEEAIYVLTVVSGLRTGP